MYRTMGTTVFRTRDGSITFEKTATRGGAVSAVFLSFNDAEIP
jgi:hypothetical protein